MLLSRVLNQLGLNDEAHAAMSCSVTFRRILPVYINVRNGQFAWWFGDDLIFVFIVIFILRTRKDAKNGPK